MVDGPVPSAGDRRAGCQTTSCPVLCPGHCDGHHSCQSGRKSAFRARAGSDVQTVSRRLVRQRLAVPKVRWPREALAATGRSTMAEGLLANALKQGMKTWIVARDRARGLVSSAVEGANDLAAEARHALATRGQHQATDRGDPRWVDVVDRTHRASAPRDAAPKARRSRAGASNTTKQKGSDASSSTATGASARRRARATSPSDAAPSRPRRASARSGAPTARARRGATEPPSPAAAREKRPPPADRDRPVSEPAPPERPSSP
jgi:hypothetical protein